MSALALPPRPGANKRSRSRRSRTAALPILKRLVTRALQYRTSDIHLEPCPEGLRVRYRIDGILRHVETLPSELRQRAIVALKAVSNLDITEHRRPQDGRIGGSEGRSLLHNLDLRVSTLPCLGGEKAVIRLLPRNNPFSSLDTLGFPDRSLQIYRRWLRQPQGLIVIAGPTGSGKSSTLYTSLQSLPTHEVNVVTIEDPIEYVSPNMTQMQVNPQIGVTFASGLRSILRQDPDIIMVGEVRDRETAQIVVQAALTGHLVFTTVHTRDTVSAISRLMELGADVGLLGDLLLGVVSQRLVRRVCPHCATFSPPTDADLQELELPRDGVNPEAWRRGRGCPKCFESGYLGREALVELLDFDRDLRGMVRRGDVDGLRCHLDDTEFYSFDRAALDKLTQGVTTLPEIRRVLPRLSDT
ncbi:MAG: type II/IV secretion system protein [Cyanobacteria bacterium SID2]|nr:type II/IV secretion system protein [Cyanobacteria bacterium SID2]MBP0003662.1 type II/IV secretion system protein [Cyanobacteria bacterium SBC]